jgi:hypothetical protein
MLRDYVVHSTVTGGQIALKAKSRTHALLSGAELLNEPTKQLALYQPTNW